MGGGALAHRNQDGLEEPTQGATACIPCSSLWTNQHTWKSTDLEFSCGSPQQARFWDIRCITQHKQILAGIAQTDIKQTEQRDGAEEVTDKQEDGSLQKRVILLLLLGGPDTHSHGLLSRAGGWGGLVLHVSPLGPLWPGPLPASSCPLGS